MCGIIGYVGMDNDAKDIIIDGLSKLEYRGYDSAGIAIIRDNKLYVKKKSGKLANLKEAIKNDNFSSHIGIGHTRWATHGEPSDKNSHPHMSMDNSVAVVHNGIIENYIDLRNELISDGVIFSSDTDSEVVAQLFAKYYNGDMTKTLKKLMDIIRGSYALGIIDINNPDKLVCARHESPLIIGLGEKKNFIASDVPAILKYTRNIIFLDNGEMAELTQDKVIIYDKNLNIINKEIHKIDWDPEQASKNGYEHFMLKEIEEEPSVINKTISKYIKNNEINFGDEFNKINFNEIDNIIIVACGTAYHAGLIGAHYLKNIAGIYATIDVASEFRYADPFINDRTLAIFISQSGETLDTLMAMRLAHSKGAKTLAITNVLGSTISRQSDITLYTLAGPEISVASTKAYIAQVVLMYILANFIGYKNKHISKEIYNENLSCLSTLSSHVENMFSEKEKIKEIAKNIYNLKNGFYIGRGIDERISREGSLKMKEVSYIHTESIAAGELKHGTIALIEKDTLVVAIATDDNMIEKMISNIKEIKARGGYIISLTTRDEEKIKEISDDTIFIDKINPSLMPLLAIIPLQLLAYYTATCKNLDVDKPRNLAKSVTVE